MRARGALARIALATALSMSAWFAASVAGTQVAVQAGFVVGALGLAASGVADVVPGRRLMSAGAFCAAGSNLLVLWAPGAWPVVLNALTGASLAAVYPPALKEVSSWFQRGRGTALGVLVGALVLGSAAPNAVRAAGGVRAEAVVVATSAMTAAGGLLAASLRGPGPYPFPRTAFDLRSAVRAVRSRRVVLANLGYLGHMWELYAMWAWIGAFLASRFPGSPRAAALAAFGCVAGGAVGCLVGGRVGDRVGRPEAAALCLALSGGSAVVLAGAGGLPTPFVVAVSAFWGFWVIADSAQFSAMVTESADPRYVGSAVSLQLALGYTTTAVTVWLVPVLVERVSWSAALLVLALGPAAGIAALLAYRRAEPLPAT